MIQEGDVFGNLTVIERDLGNKRRWHCRCSCGNIVAVFDTNLKTGRTKSCGCLKGDGSSKNSLYNRFQQMKHHAGCDWTYQEFVTWLDNQPHGEPFRVIRYNKTLPYSEKNCYIKQTI